MIAVEMMITKIEEGYDKIKAATFAYTSTAFPMLTGTLVTIAGFVPVGFAAERRRRILLLAVRRRRHRAHGLLDRRGAVHAAHRRVHPARQAKGHGHEPSALGPRCSMRMLDRVLRSAMRVLGGTVALFVASLVGMQLRAAAVLPELRPARAAGRPDAAAKLLAQRDAQGRRRAREAAQGRSRRRALVVLCRQRRHPLLPAARPAARERLLRPGGRRDQGLQGARRPCSSASWSGLRGRDSSRCLRAYPARARAAGRLAAQVPHQRPRSGEGARAGAELRAGARQQPERPQHQFRLERALEGDPGRGRPGPRARARHQLAALGQTSTRCSRAPP